MGRIVISNDALRLEVDPALGAGLADLSLRGPRGRWWPVLRRAVSDCDHFNELASYTLAPWCNRVDAGRFTFDGRERTLVVNWPDGTAIHGDVCTREWTILDRSPVSARLEFDARETPDRNWPWPYRARVRYQLEPLAVRTEIDVVNESNAPMPAGVGFHPYFLRTLWNSGDIVEVRADVAGRYPCERIMPVGPARPDSISRALSAGTPLDALGDLDDVFPLGGGSPSIRWPASGVNIAFESSPEMGHVVIYSPAQDDGFMPWFCFEPVSMVNNGFNLMHQGWNGTGVRTILPGESLRAAWTMRFTTEAR